jgi:imidazolonepropionase-like amidohydrolase
MQILVGARLIDGTGAPPVPDAAVLIDVDGRIQAVGPRHTVTAPPGAVVHDVAGLTMLPGLIDGHDHLASHGYALTTRWGLDEPQSTTHLRTAAVLQQTLNTGYTTVRDAAGLDAGFKQAIEGGLIAGPRLQLALGIISPIGGIGDRISPSGHSCCVPPSPNVPPSVANGVQEVRNVVRSMVRSGADVIKCATTGGASSRPGHGPNDPAFNRDEMQALVDEAHTLGPGLRLAIEVGVDSIEHGCYLDEDPELIPMMVEKGIVFVPTLTVYVFHRKRSAPQHVQERGHALYAHHIKSIQRTLEAGGKIVAGTDAGGHQHGINARELYYLVEAGLSPMQALQAGTQWAAEGLGLAHDIGTIEAGKWADVVVIDGDPLQNIALLQQTERIKLVLKGGAVCLDQRKQS